MSKINRRKIVRDQVIQTTQPIRMLFQNDPAFFCLISSLDINDMWHLLRIAAEYDIIFPYFSYVITPVHKWNDMIRFSYPFGIRIEHDDGLSRKRCAFGLDPSGVDIHFTSMSQVKKRCAGKIGRRCTYEAVLTVRNTLVIWETCVCFAHYYRPCMVVLVMKEGYDPDDERFMHHAQAFARMGDVQLAGGTLWEDLKIRLKELFDYWSVDNVRLRPKVINNVLYLTNNSLAKTIYLGEDYVHDGEYLRVAKAVPQFFSLPKNTTKFDKVVRPRVMSCATRGPVYTIDDETGAIRKEIQFREVPPGPL